jgi:hypothetical protein
VVAVGAGVWVAVAVGVAETNAVFVGVRDGVAVVCVRSIGVSVADGNGV